jgi:hypothetical protein
MRVRAALLLLGVLAPAVAGANIHKEELFMAPSYVHQSSVFGLHVSGARSISHGTPETPARAGSPSYHPHPWSAVLDLSAHFAGDDHDVLSGAVGLRRSFRTRHPAEDRHDPESTYQQAFVQVLAGVVNRKVEGLDGQTDFLAGVGVGWDFMFGKRRKMGLRIQADALFPGFDDVFPRVSVGFVVRRQHKPHAHD